MTDNNAIHKIWWLWLPILIIIGQIGLEILIPADILSVMHSENGPHEFLQFSVILAAFFVSLAILGQFYKGMNLWLIIWVIIAAICSLYVAGEEVSWGQHFLSWSTPEYWATLNDQGETNLHNTSSWLDQKPRIILEIGVIMGGLLIPLLIRAVPKLLPVRFAIIYPSALLGVTSGLFLSLKIADKAEGAGVFFFERVSEVQEIYLFYFVLLYLLMLRKKISANMAAS